MKKTWAFSIIGFIGFFILAALQLAAGAAFADPGHEAGASVTSQSGAPQGHAATEGLVLRSLASDAPLPTSPGEPCRPDAPQKSFNVIAIDVDITINKFGMHDPLGRIYALRNRLADIRAQEASGEVGTGLGNDPIQPLTIRANLGDCVTVNFTNMLASETASIHIHGAAYDVKSAGSAVGFNPNSLAKPSQSITYRWYIDPAVYFEGAFYFHSHGAQGRQQTVHGLFGALIAEPAGSTYLNDKTGAALESGWSAIIADPSGPDFRERAIFYHEVGDETFQLLDRNDSPVPLVDPLAHSYRPGGRALNYRSEPHGARLKLQQDRVGFHDESQGYGSYTFGEPGQPIPRSYVGDPEKQRLIHGGSEVFHVHHLHGGSVRWRFQPKTDDPVYNLGYTKTPPLRPKSIRKDVQALGPSEVFNAEIECGAGGCQQATGDYLYHCHIPQHYVSGMWSFWRVYNTLQTEGTSADGMDALIELPDRAGRMEPAVNSVGLLGTELLDGTVLDSANIESWIERWLPPQGVPAGYDASVWDWQKEVTATGGLYRGEPETNEIWPHFRSPTPGERPQILFDPVSAKPAYPMLRPHLGKRPPFASGHGGAPGLGLRATEDNPRALFPTGAPERHFNIKAIEIPLKLTRTKNDPFGTIFVLADEEAAVRRNADKAEPLTIRANVGDAVTHTFVNELTDRPEFENFSKVNVHVHFFQFDPQASDGVISGMSYEQSVRPYQTEGITLLETASVGAATVRVTNIGKLHRGALLGIGLGTNQIEQRKVLDIDPATGTVTLDSPLLFAHAAGSFAGNEFVNYAWFVDALTGQVFFHDHVFGLTTWGHGLFGSLITEPPRSTYHDPKTGNEIKTGAIADIHTDFPYAPGIVDGSFRELALYIQENPIVGSTFNFKAEPWSERMAVNPDPSLIFSSVTHGDPITPLPRAYLGDPFVIRLLVGSMNEVHSFHLAGQRFALEGFRLGSPVTDTITIGIAERFNLILDGGAGGTMGQPGDYLYFNGIERHFREGMWGLIRVHDTLQSDLQPLPDRTPPLAGPGHPRLTVTGGRPEKAEPPEFPEEEDGARVVRYDVVATEVNLPPEFNFGGRVKLFALARDEAALTSGDKDPEPLVLRANAGDIVEVRLTNHLTQNRASFNTGLLRFDPKTSLGITAGLQPDQTVGPGETITYRYLADRPLGAAWVGDFGDPIGGRQGGLYGSIVVSPEGYSYRNPATGDPLYRDSDADGFLDTTCTGDRCANTWEAMIEHPSLPPFRDFAGFLHEEDKIFGTNVMPYQNTVQGRLGINYRRVDMSRRLQLSEDRVFSSFESGDPITPLFRAYVGEPTIFHVLHAFGEQVQVASIDGHRVPVLPGIEGANRVTSQAIGPSQALNAILDGGAGGLAGAAGDYMYLNHRLAYMEGGMWGIFRVHASRQPDLVPLPELAAPPVTTTTTTTTTTTVPVTGAGAEDQAPTGGSSPGPAATTTGAATAGVSVTGAVVAPGVTLVAPSVSTQAQPRARILQLTGVSVSPNPFTPDGDRKNDFTRIRFTLDRPAVVSLEIFSFRGREKLLLSNVRLPAGTLVATWTGTDNRGKILPTGNYRYVVHASAGGIDQTFSGVVRVKSKVSFAAFFRRPAQVQPTPSAGPSAKAPRATRPVAAVGAPLVSGLRVSPDPFSPGRVVDDGVALTVQFRLARKAIASLRILDSEGRLIKTIFFARSLAAGAHQATWDGRGFRGRPVPPGAYQAVVVASAPPIKGAGSVRFRVAEPSF